MSQVSPVSTVSNAELFHREGMLIAECPISGYFVVDRLPMRNCAGKKNCRNRWQLLSADQSEYTLFRSRQAAIDALAEKTKYVAGFNIEKILAAYVECALWSSTDYDTDEPLDKKYTADNVDKKTLAAMRTDIVDFVAANANWLDIDNLNTGARVDLHRQIGHDFWLTRNGHGAGFWDGQWWESAGRALTEASKIYGTVDLYVCKGKVYSQ